MHAASRAHGRRARDQGVLNPLMIPLPVIVIDKLSDSLPEVALPKRNHAVETFLL
jgi:hypothetical protein